jgi:hypothetical protein
MGLPYRNDQHFRAYCAVENTEVSGTLLLACIAYVDALRRIHACSALPLAAFLTESRTIVHGLRHHATIAVPLGNVRCWAL